MPLFADTHICVSFCIYLFIFLPARFGIIASTGAPAVLGNATARPSPSYARRGFPSLGDKHTAGRSLPLPANASIDWSRMPQTPPGGVCMGVTFVLTAVANCAMARSTSKMYLHAVGRIGAAVPRSGECTSFPALPRQSWTYAHCSFLSRFPYHRHARDSRRSLLPTMHCTLAFVILNNRRNGPESRCRISVPRYVFSTVRLDSQHRFDVCLASRYNPKSNGCCISCRS